jgi:hypothetical protein
VDELVRVGQAVIEEIGALAEDSGNQFVSLAKRARTNRRMIQVVAVSVALDILLSVVIGLGWNTLHDLTHRLDVSQTTTRQRTLCPLYGLFLASENPRSRAVYPQGPAAYDAAFQVIRDGYAALDCGQFAARPAPSPSPS